MKCHLIDIIITLKLLKIHYKRYSKQIGKPKRKWFFYSLQ